MNRFEQRLLLEEIAYASDPSVTARDRLRALELLAELEEAELEEDEDEEEEEVEDSDEELRVESDEVLAELVLAIVTGDEKPASVYPRTTAVLRLVLEERARELAKAIPDFVAPPE